MRCTSKGLLLENWKKLGSKQVMESIRVQISISDDLAHPIPDPKVQWKVMNEIWIAEEVKNKKKTDIDTVVGDGK